MEGNTMKDLYSFPELQPLGSGGPRAHVDALDGAAIGQVQVRPQGRRESGSRRRGNVLDTSIPKKDK